MTPFRKRAEAAAKRLLDETDARHGSVCWPGNKYIADAIEAEAKAFAERALREVLWTKRRQVYLSADEMWCVMATAKSVDGLHGLAFATEDAARQWLDKSIAAAIEAAERSET